MIKRFLPIVIIGTCFLFYSPTRQCNRENVEREKQELIEALNDSIKYYKNENEKTVASLKVVQTSSIENFTNLVTANNEIKRLQELVKKSGKNTKVATQVATKTIVDTTYHIERIYQGWEHNLEEDFGNWITGYVSFAPTDRFDEEGNRKFFSTIKLEVKDKLNIVHKRDNNGMYVEVTNENPFSKVETLRSYYKTENSFKTTEKIKRFSIGPNLSYGINYRGEFLPYVGIGIQYNLIKF